MLNVIFWLINLVQGTFIELPYTVGCLENEDRRPKTKDLDDVSAILEI